MKNASPAFVLAAGVLVLCGLFGLNYKLSGHLALQKQMIASLAKEADTMNEALTDMRSVKAMKERDMALFTSGMSSIAQTKKAVYESGLALQEEKRLLEKQLEIITTSIRVDLENSKISLMREDHSLADYPVVFTSTHAVTDAVKKSGLRIISKERFAHPERGKLEEKDGVLTWIPPQVGQSLRSNALGEFVMFTNSNVVIHGPFKKLAEHQAYPHACLGLTPANARKLYQSSFIGTRILFVKDSSNQAGTAP